MFSFKFARAEKEGWVLSGFKKTDFLPPFGGSIKTCCAVKWVLAARLCLLPKELGMSQILENVLDAAAPTMNIANVGVYSQQ